MFRADGIRALLARLRGCARTRLPWPAASNRARRQARPRRACLVVPDGLEDYGWGLIDWRGLPGRAAVGLLRAADRIAREGHAVAFTGQEYQSGPELTVDGHLTVARYLSPPGTAAPTVSAQDLLAAVLADLMVGVARVAIVCEQPELSEEAASQTITAGPPTTGPPRTGVDLYGYGWTIHT